MLTSIKIQIDNAIADKTPYSKYYLSYLMRLQDELIANETYKVLRYSYNTVKDANQSTQSAYNKLNQLLGDLYNEHKFNNIER